MDVPGLWRAPCDRAKFALSTQVAILPGWRNEVSGKNVIAIRKGELAIVPEKGEAAVVDLEAQQ